MSQAHGDPTPAANVPHRFVEPPDPRAGLAASAAHAQVGQASQVSLADASLREIRCAVPGCGRARDDEIHQAEE